MATFEETAKILSEYRDEMNQRVVAIANECDEPVQVWNLTSALFDKHGVDSHKTPVWFLFETKAKKQAGGQFIGATLGGQELSARS